MRTEHHFGGNISPVDDFSELRHSSLGGRRSNMQHPLENTERDTIVYMLSHCILHLHKQTFRHNENKHERNILV